MHLVMKCCATCFYWDECQTLEDNYCKRWAFKDTFYEEND